MFRRGNGLPAGVARGGWAVTFRQALAPSSTHTWLSASETLLLPGALGSLGVTSIYMFTCWAEENAGGLPASESRWEESRR